LIHRQILFGDFLVVSKCSFSSQSVSCGIICLQMPCGSIFCGLMQHSDIFPNTSWYQISKSGYSSGGKSLVDEMKDICASEY